MPSSFGPLEISFLIAQFLVPLIFALICAKLAQYKGRRAALWALFGFIFQILTLLVLVVLPTKTQSSG